MKDFGLLLILVLVVIALSKKASIQQPVNPEYVYGTTNEETMEWTDYRGKEYKITIHRQVT